MRRVLWVGFCQIIARPPGQPMKFDVPKLSGFSVSFLPVIEQARRLLSVFGFFLAAFGVWVCDYLVAQNVFGCVKLSGFVFASIKCHQCPCVSFLKASGTTIGFWLVEQWRRHFGDAVASPALDLFGPPDRQQEAGSTKSDNCSPVWVGVCDAHGNGFVRCSSIDWAQDSLAARKHQMRESWHRSCFAAGFLRQKHCDSEDLRENARYTETLTSLARAWPARCIHRLTHAAAPC